MLEILKALIFGIVEGITEWLPISSTGHIILLNEFMPLNVSQEFMEGFEVVIQLGVVFIGAAQRLIIPFHRFGLLLF